MTRFPLTKKDFIAWLVKQPDNREFRFVEGNEDSITGCSLCNCFREKGLKNFFIGALNFGFHGNSGKLPLWANRLSLHLAGHPERNNVQYIKQYLTTKDSLCK